MSKAAANLDRWMRSAFVAKAREFFERQSAAPATSAALSVDDRYFREVMLLSQPKIKGFEELDLISNILMEKGRSSFRVQDEARCGDN